jgi:hypothetical protein
MLTVRFCLVPRFRIAELRPHCPHIFMGWWLSKRGDNSPRCRKQVGEERCAVHVTLPAVFRPAAVCVYVCAMIRPHNQKEPRCDNRTGALNIVQRGIVSCLLSSRSQLWQTVDISLCCAIYLRQQFHRPACVGIIWCKHSGTSGGYTTSCCVTDVIEYRSACGGYLKP